MKIVTTPRAATYIAERGGRGLGLARSPARPRGFLRLARGALRAAEVEPALELHPQLAAPAHVQGRRRGRRGALRLRSTGRPRRAASRRQGLAQEDAAASRPTGTAVCSSARMSPAPGDTRRRRDPVSRGRDSGSDPLPSDPRCRPHDLGTDRPVEDLDLEACPGLGQLGRKVGVGDRALHRVADAAARHARDD